MMDQRDLNGAGGRGYRSSYVLQDQQQQQQHLTSLPQQHHSYPPQYYTEEQHQQLEDSRLRQGTPSLLSGSASASRIRQPALNLLPPPPPQLPSRRSSSSAASSPVTLYSTVSNTQEDLKAAATTTTTGSLLGKRTRSRGAAAGLGIASYAQEQEQERGNRTGGPVRKQPKRERGTSVSKQYFEDRSATSSPTTGNTSNTMSSRGDSKELSGVGSSASHHHDDPMPSTSDFVKKLYK
jgi:hypothetical protein